MNMKEQIESIDLSKAKHQFGTIPAYILTILIGSGITLNKQIADIFGFATVARADILEAKVDNLTTTVQMDIALRQITKAGDALAVHMDVTDNLKTPSWGATQRSLKRRLELTEDYKKCVLQGLQRKSTESPPDCGAIQRQLWQ